MNFFLKISVPITTQNADVSSGITLYTAITFPEFD